MMREHFETGEINHFVEAYAKRSYRWYWPWGATNESCITTNEKNEVEINGVPVNIVKDRVNKFKSSYFFTRPFRLLFTNIRKTRELYTMHTVSNEVKTKRTTERLSEESLKLLDEVSFLSRLRLPPNLLPSSTSTFEMFNTAKRIALTLVWTISHPSSVYALILFEKEKYNKEAEAQERDSLALVPKGVQQNGENEQTFSYQYVSKLLEESISSADDFIIKSNFPNWLDDKTKFTQIIESHCEKVKKIIDDRAYDRDLSFDENLQEIENDKSRLISKIELKKQYLKLCLKYHPDKHSLSTEPRKVAAELAFKLLQGLYDNLQSAYPKIIDLVERQGTYKKYNEAINVAIEKLEEKLLELYKMGALFFSRKLQDSCNTIEKNNQTIQGAIQNLDNNKAFVVQVGRAEVGFLSESDARGYLQERSDLSENVKIFLSTFRCEDVEELSIGSEISDNMLTEVNFKTFNSFEQACDFICNYRQEFDKKLEKLNIKYNVSCTEVKDAKNEGFIISLEQVEANEDSPHRMANK